MATSIGRDQWLGWQEIAQRYISDRWCSKLRDEIESLSAGGRIASFFYQITDEDGVEVRVGLLTDSSFVGIVLREGNLESTAVRMDAIKSWVTKKSDECYRVDIYYSPDRVFSYVALLPDHIQELRIFVQTIDKLTIKRKRNQ